MVERPRLVMLNMDPPRHTGHCGLVNRGFTPRMIGLLEEQITRICSSLLDDVARQGEADFVSDIAAPLPSHAICELVGAPLEDRDQICEPSKRVIGIDDPEVGSLSDGIRAVAEMCACAGELAACRREQPANDIVTKLLQPDDAGKR